MFCRVFFFLFYTIEAQIRVLPLGNSITQGRVDQGSTKPVVYSYRYPLWQMLDSTGINFDMVGSIDHNFQDAYIDYPDADFDLDHEGHWGWTTGGILAELAGWLDGYTPDIALIHLGTNDGNTDSLGTVNNLKNIIDTLRADNPNVTIVLPKLMTPWITVVNKSVDSIAKEKSTAQSQIIVIDQSDGFINDPSKQNTDTWDWVHTNTSGDRKMAEKWYTAIINNFGLLDSDPPHIPEGLNITDTSENSVSLQWLAAYDSLSPVSYKIYLNNDSIGSTNDTVFQVNDLTPDSSYDFSIMAYDLANNVSAQSDKITIKINKPVSVEHHFVDNQGNNGIIIYPNPACTRVYIASDISLKSFEIIDVNGRQLIKQHLQGCHKHSIDLDLLQTGLYFCKIIGSDGSHFIKKIIKGCN